jgi:hypothetical protein
MCRGEFGKIGTLYTVGWNAASTVENSMVRPQKIKNRIIFDSVTSLLSIYKTELKTGTQRDICTHMSTAKLLIIAYMWK